MFRVVIPLLVTSALAQSPDRPKFDVAAIKPAHRFQPLRALPGGRLTAAAPLRLLIENAYSLFTFQIVGGSDWMKSEVYEIDAKVDGDPGKDQLLSMLRSLLEDRFQMKTHRETKELPVFTLIVAKGGPKLSPPKEGSCEGSDPTAPLVAQCGRISIERDVREGRVTDRIHGGPVDMAELARTLSTMMGRSVIDKTGITKTFDVQMEFTPDLATSGLPPRSASSDNPEPTIFVALQEKLGLKLESTKGPVEMLVIDHAERPSGN